MVRLAVALRNDELAQLAPDRLISGPAENLFGDAVLAGDDAILTHYDHCIECSFEDGRQIRQPGIEGQFHWVASIGCRPRIVQRPDRVGRK